MKKCITLFLFAWPFLCCGMDTSKNRRRLPTKLSSIPTAAPLFKTLKKKCRSCTTPLPSITLGRKKIIARKCSDETKVESGYKERIDLVVHDTNTHETNPLGFLSILFKIERILFQETGDINVICKTEEQEYNMIISSIFALQKNKKESNDVPFQFILTRSKLLYFSPDGTFKKVKTLHHNNQNA